MKINPNFKAGAQKGSTNYNERVTLIATPEGKFPPQAGNIIEALLKAKDYSLTVGELVGFDGSKESEVEKVGLETVQTPIAIWNHYKPRLLKENLVKLG